MTYSLHALLTNGERRELLEFKTGNADAAMFIEGQIERFLGIEDTAVKEEYRRRVPVAHLEPLGPLRHKPWWRFW